MISPEPSTLPGARAEGRLVEFSHSPREALIPLSRVGVLFLYVLIGMLAISMGLLTFGGITGVANGPNWLGITVGLAVAAIPLAIPFIFSRLRTRARKLAVLRTIGDVPPAAAIDAAFRFMRLHPGMSLEVLVALLQRLWRDGYSGCAVRSSRSTPTAVEPIRAPFEARRLNEFDSSFEELRSATSSDVKYGVDARQAAYWFRGALPFVAIAIWAVALGPGVYPAIAIGLAIGFGIPVLRHIRARRGWQALRTLGGLGEAPISARWWIAPSSVVLVWPDGQRWRVHVCDRENHLLFVYPERTKWRVCLFDGTLTLTREFSEIECVMLLRAWLSPIPPPDPNGFRDWLEADR